MRFQGQNTPRQGKSLSARAPLGATGAGKDGRRGVRGRALVIEDDPLMADVLTRHLEVLGYGPVSIATTAEEALVAVEVSALTCL